MSASGHKLTSTYWEIWDSDLYLYEVIEVIEMIAEVHRKSSPEMDLDDLLGV